MKSRISVKQHLANAGLVAAMTVLMSSGCAIAPRADGPFFAEAGSTWTYERRDTGSFGKDTKRQTIKALGERNWQGRRVRALETAQGTRLSDPVTAEWLAMVQGDKTLMIWEPPLGWDWPLTVGKSFQRNYRYVLPMTNKSFDIRSTMTVESLEEVTVPAGTFKAFKVRYTDSFGAENVTWYSPDGAGFVKTRSTRNSKFPSGPGTQETDLLSYSLKKN